MNTWINIEVMEVVKELMNLSFDLQKNGWIKEAKANHKKVERILKGQRKLQEWYNR